MWLRVGHISAFYPLWMKMYRSTLEKTERLAKSLFLSKHMSSANETQQLASLRIARTEAYGGLQVYPLELLIKNLKGIIHTWLLGCEDLFLTRRFLIRRCYWFNSSKITEMKVMIFFFHSSFSPLSWINVDPTSPDSTFLQRRISTQNKHDNPYWSHLARNQPLSLKFELL